MKAYHLRSHPDIAKMLCNYFDLKAKEKQYLSDISAMENALTTGRQIESTESLIRSIVFARHEHIGGASNRTSDPTHNAANQLIHEIQAQDKATEDIQRVLARRKNQLEGIQREIAQVDTYMQTLTSTEQQLICLYYDKQYSLPRIAETLLINQRHYSIKTIKRAKQEALRKLAMVIVPDDISTPLKPP